MSADLPKRPSDTVFWTALLGLVTLTFASEIGFMMRTQPADVLREVQELRNDLEVRTMDRFYRVEFNSFLEENQDKGLKPPRVRPIPLTDAQLDPQ